MDLWLEDRAVWVISPTPESANALAGPVLDEGARVAIFCDAADAAVRSLRARFGFRVLTRAAPAVSRSWDESIRSAVHWGGRPAGLIVHLPAPMTFAQQETWLEPCVDELAADAGLLIFREQQPPSSCPDPEVAFRRALEADLRAADRLAGGRARVSVLGRLSSAPASPAGSAITAREPMDAAAASLGLFLVGRGHGQLMMIGEEGLIHAT